MLCEEFQNMTPYEKSLFNGQLLHVCMNDSAMLQMGKDLIELGMRKGLFDNATILPDVPNHNEPKGE